MNLFIKKIIFTSLILLFFIYTIVVYTIGTSNDAGLNLLNEQSKKGKLLFQKYNCIACHQLYGLGGYMGPDLTNIISQKNKGPIYAKAFLSNGTVRMPNYELKENEMNELIAYLDYLDKTGVSPVKYFNINYSGTISQHKK